jgi:hypothetical protein
VLAAEPSEDQLAYFAAVGAPLALAHHLSHKRADGPVVPRPDLLCGRRICADCTVDELA